jgi:hypothetical protein
MKTKEKSKAKTINHHGLHIAILVFLAITALILRYLGLKNIQNKYNTNLNYWCGIGIDSSPSGPTNILTDGIIGYSLAMTPPIFLGIAVYLTIQRFIKQKWLKIILSLIVVAIVAVAEFVEAFVMLGFVCGFDPGGF